MRVWLECARANECWEADITGRTLFCDLGEGLRAEACFGEPATGSAAYLRIDLGRDGAWFLQAQGTGLFVNGQPLTRPRALQDRDSLHGEGWRAVFRIKHEPPLFRGAEFTEVPLAGVTRLVLGRREVGEESRDRIDLDADLHQLSRNHVSIEQLGGRYVASDTSRTGATLNGQRFDARHLVVGDRLILGPYSFEFTGWSLRTVKPRIGAEVHATDVGVHAGGRMILDGVSLTVAACSFVGILGGSGQGKSTLMKALCGIRPPTRGRVSIDGEDAGASQAAGKAGVGYVPQDDIVHMELTVEQAILHSARLRLDARIPPTEISALVDDIIGRLGLDEHRTKRIHSLSGGQRKRVSIATELLAKPAALFLDEPSSGLDPATEYQLMRLLRHLAAADCTVVCTTHVLGRAYLFDRLLFIHGGRMVFDGTPEEAREFFGVETLDMVYIKLDESSESAEEVEARFTQWRELKGGGLSGGQADAAIEAPEARRRTPRGIFTPMLTQLARLRDITVSDRLAMIYLLAQPVLIALLIGWVAEDYVLRLFLCLVAVLWFGCSNGAQQIVKERPVFTREKLCGVGANPYLLSKYFLHGVITAAQGLLLFLVAQTVAIAVHPPSLGATPMIAEMTRLEEDRRDAGSGQIGVGDAGDFVAVELGQPSEPASVAEPLAPPRQHTLGWFRALAARMAWFAGAGENVLDASRQNGAGFWAAWSATLGLKLAALAGTAVVGVAMGLAISALVQTATQSVLWVPLILIPQILLGGVVLVRPELSAAARALAGLTPSYSAQRIIDVSNVFGLQVPFLANRTKLPVFLTPGEKERVEWTLGGKSYSQSYDRISPVNRSWQNLLVYPTATGQHASAYTEVVTRENSKRRIFLDTAEARNDVKYRKGTVYENLWPAWRALQVLLAWIMACYILTLSALRRTATP